MTNQFTVTIDDTFCVYKYVVNLPDDVAIYDIIKTICDKYKIETPEAIHEKNQQLKQQKLQRKNELP
jgi:hypothetical protein